MDKQTLATVVSTIVASLIASFVAYFVAQKSNKYAQESRFNDHILEINRLAMQYPYLEDNAFCDSWFSNRHSQDEKYQRYDNYCCIVFNLIEQMWKFYNGDNDKIKNMLTVSELAKRHKGWWKFPSDLGENIYGYDYEFSLYLESQLR